MNKVVSLLKLSTFQKLTTCASAGLLIVLGLASCEEGIQVFAPNEFTPVVYCLLDPKDSVQTVRVSRLFQDKRSQAEWQSLYDEYLADTLNRTYIEAIDTTGVRTVTYFRWSEQIRSASDSVYACTNLFTANLKPGFGQAYQLYVYFPEISKMASAKIRTLTQIQLVDPAIVPGRKMVIAPSQPYVIRWYGSQQSAYFQGVADLNYLEEDSVQIVAKSVRMQLRPVMESKTEILNSQNISGMHFLQTLRDQIPVQAGVRRKMTDIDFTFYFAGPELALFANSGFDPKGAEGTVVDFTNLDNARGLFSSISNIRVAGVPLADQTLDTIALHELTRNLNFLRSNEDFQ